MSDPDGIALMLGILFLLGLCLVLAAGVQWIVSKPKRNRFQHHDHVAARKRVIVRNGFKTRMGVK